MIQAPTEISTALSDLDAREDIFEVHDAESSVQRAIEKDEIPEDKKLGWWAECAAFGFHARPTPDGGPWKTYFQPMMTWPSDDGNLICSPDLTQANEKVVEYWSLRAKAVMHPVLVARYADLVWDTEKFVTGDNPSIVFAHLAIDSYIDTANKDDGEVRMEIRSNLSRALNLALSISDNDRIEKVVAATIDYVERTSDDNKIGTYCYLFDNLLPSKKGPTLSAEKEQKIIEMFESKFVMMTTPGSQWDVDPHSPQSIGLRLASYYQRKSREEDRKRVVEAIARAFERRAKLGDAMVGLMFLEDARKYFVEAGLKDEATRIQRESQELAPDAKKGMTSQTTEFEISFEMRDRYLDSLLANGLLEGLYELTTFFVPSQVELQKEIDLRAKQYPLQAMFPPTLIGDEGITAQIDVPDDPDGRMAYETAFHMKLNSVWLSWGLDHLIQNGLTATKVLEQVALSPLFTEDRLPLIRRGIEAHIVGDYIQSIHILVPQIERAIVGLTFLLGGTSTKPHRSGRAVMQAKSLNDALDDEAVRQVLGPDRRMYFVATLSHPKGFNIRNNVCHGLWPPEVFRKDASERVLHVLLALSQLREKKS